MAHLVFLYVQFVNPKGDHNLLWELFIQPSQTGRLENEKQEFSQGAMEILTYGAHTIMDFQFWHRPLRLTVN